MSATQSPPPPTRGAATPAPAKPAAAAAPAAAPAAGLIAGRYAVSQSRPLPEAGGGLAAFEATDTAGSTVPLMAVQVRPAAPPRAVALQALADLIEPRALLPLACGAAPTETGPAWFVICQAPPGAPLWPGGATDGRAWSEAALVLRLLRPVATALDSLATKHITHRAVRPNNLFVASEADDVVLGSAWAGPPAMLQPAVFEPPYVAMCHPASRGEGTAADDVYALGVTLLALAFGRLPMAGLSDEAVIARKLELGCFHALTAGLRLSPLLADLLSGMLASDPQQRPPPSLLADPAAARSRRIANRPQRRAAQPLQVDSLEVWNARMLAYGIARHPVTAARLLRIGVVDHWLRRSLNDAVLAGRLEEVVRQRGSDASAAAAQADGWMALRAAVLLDPLAPLCWHGLALWPDGLGPALAAAMAESEGGEARRSRLGDLVNREAIAIWAAARPEHCDQGALRMDARDYRAVARERGWAGGLARLCYALNPLLPCRSPLLAPAAVAGLNGVLPALEAVAGREARRPRLPLDRETAAFLAARLNGRGDNDLGAITDASAPDDVTLMQLRVLANLQTQLAAPPVPRLAAWLHSAAAPLLARWHGRSRRTTKQAQLAELAAAGNLSLLLQAMDNPNELRSDAEGWRQATAAAKRIDSELASLAAGAAKRAVTGQRIGQETAAALALAAFAAAAVYAAIG